MRGHHHGVSSDFAHPSTAPVHQHSPPSQRHTCWQEDSAKNPATGSTGNINPMAKAQRDSNSFSRGMNETHNSIKERLETLRKLFQQEDEAKEINDR